MSYSARSSSERLLARFTVRMSFFSCRLPRAYDPNSIIAVKVRHENNPPAGRFASGDVPPLAFRAIRILVGNRQRVKEYAGGFREVDPVLLDVACSLSCIPLVNHRPSLRRSPSQPCGS